MDVGYPKFIHREFPGIDYQVDAAFEKRGKSQSPCQCIMILFVMILMIYLTFSGYLYFSHGFRQKEYHYEQRRARRTLLNYEWMGC